MFYIIIIKYAFSEMRMQNLLVNYRHLIIVIFSFSFILFLEPVHLINSFNILKLLKLVGFQMMNMRDVSEFIYLLT